jgi:hypothetical protein
MTFRSRIPKMITLHEVFLGPFLYGHNREVTMDGKEKQRAVIEFLLFEGRAGEEIVIRLRNLYDLVE